MTSPRVQISCPPTLLSHRLLAPVLAACSLVGAAQAASAQPTSTLQVNSRLVVLDLAVTDQQGRAVTNLRQQDFRIFESGVPQTIFSFEPPTAHAMPPAISIENMVRSTADLHRIGQAPVTVLVLDELNMKFEDETYARNELIKWLAAQPPILAQPTTLLAVTYNDFHVVTDYTQDRDQLLKSLKTHQVIYPWRKEHDGKTGGAASEVLAESLGALEQIAQASRGVPGRKNVIWVGDGFPSLGTSDVGVQISDHVHANLRKLTQVMLAARVTLYIIGPTLKAMQPETIETGVDAEAPADTGVQVNQNDIQFASLAAPTGGHAYTNRNDMDREIGQSVASGANYYTLSYIPTDTSDNPKKYRKIRVDILRPGLLAATRDGYFQQPLEPASAAAPSEKQLAFDLYGAALSNLAYTDLHLTAERKDAGSFILHAAARDITWRELPDGRRHADLVLLAVCLSAKNKVLARTASTLGSNTQATLGQMSGAPTSLPMQVSPPPGTARIRFVVRDMQSGRVGTADLTP